MGNFNNNNNRNGGNDKGKNKMFRHLQAGPQRHIITDMIGKYGINFMGIANVNKEFDSQFKIIGLIRTIFKAKFDFTQYGQYLIGNNNPLLEKMIEYADSKWVYVNFNAKAGALLLNRNNPKELELTSTSFVNANEIVIWNSDAAVAWSIVLNALTACRNTADINPMIMGVNSMSTARDSHGKPLCFLL